jgi:hypothetical protein
MKLVRTAALVSVLAVSAPAFAGQPPDVSTNARKSDKVVLAVVEDVQPRFTVNEFGDRLIVSQVWLRVEETLKGTAQGLVSMDLEGGTVGDLTLSVSDLPKLKKGDRGVFLLDTTTSGTHRPHGRGDGILQLDASDHVAGSNLRLADVKASVKASQK